MFMTERLIVRTSHTRPPHTTKPPPLDPHQIPRSHLWGTMRGMGSLFEITYYYCMFMHHMLLMHYS